MIRRFLRSARKSCAAVLFSKMMSRFHGIVSAVAKLFLSPSSSTRSLFAGIFQEQTTLQLELCIVCNRSMDTLYSKQNKKLGNTDVAAAEVIAYVENADEDLLWRTQKAAILAKPVGCEECSWVPGASECAWCNCYCKDSMFLACTECSMYCRLRCKQNHLWVYLNTNLSIPIDDDDFPLGWDTAPRNFDLQTSDVDEQHQKRLGVLSNWRNIFNGKVRHHRMRSFSEVSAMDMQRLHHRR